MRILIVSQYFWPENFVINDLALLLAARGQDVSVLTGKPNYPQGSFFAGYRGSGVMREDFGTVSVMRLPVAARGQNSKIRLAFAYLSFIVSASVLGPWVLRRQPFDAVFVYAPSPLLQALPAVLLSKLRRVPLVVWVQDLWPESLSATGHVQSRAILGAVSALVRFIYRSSDRILVQSEAFRAPVAAYADAGKIHYYPNPYVEKSEHQPSERAQALSRRLSQTFSVVFAGNLGTAQSLDTIVRAAEMLRSRSDIKFFIIGSGSCEKLVATRADELNLSNVELCGRFEAQDMETILSSASGLLVTLTAAPIFALTVPSKLQAYLAAGRPIIAALNGEGARIVQESGGGFAGAAEDAEGLVRSIEKLAALSDTERSAMGARGRAYFDKHFSGAMLADALIGHLRQLTNEVDRKP